MIEFQSAHPVRGATARASSFRSPRPDFNPRTSQTPTGSRRFQSTRPVWGATLAIFFTALLDKISIHAPRVGRDTRRPPRSATAADFNPRAPCGARPDAQGCVCAAVRNFNPRAPCGARLTGGYKVWYTQDFNPRAPCGARRGRGYHGRFLPYFNPRAPCGARLAGGGRADLLP